GAQMMHLRRRAKLDRRLFRARGMVHAERRPTKTSATPASNTTTAPTIGIETVCSSFAVTSIGPAFRTGLSSVWLKFSNANPAIQKTKKQIPIQAILRMAPFLGGPSKERPKFPKVPASMCGDAPAIGKRLGHMRPLHALAAFQIGNGA